MRKIQTTDFFKAVRLIRAANLKTEIKDIIEEVDKKKKEIKKLTEDVLSGQEEATDVKVPKFSVKDVGFDIVFTVIEKVADTKVEDAFYEFISGPLEKTVEEVQVMEITELINEFEAADWEEWKKLFSRASDVTS